MVFKKTYLILLIPLLAVLIFFAFQLNFDFGLKKNELNNTVFASQQNIDFELMEFVSQETAQKSVDFNLVIPKTLNGLDNPITVVAKPPKEAVYDELVARKLTRVESYYLSMDSNDEGISLVQTNHEIIQMNFDGEPLNGKIIEISGTKINSYECDCIPTKKIILWWYDGNVTTEITIFGEKNLQKGKKFIEEILEKS